MRTSVKRKLTASYLAVALFVLVSAGLALYTFVLFDKTLTLITQSRLPPMLLAQSLASHVERILASVPALMAAMQESERETVASRLDKEMQAARQLMVQVRAYAHDEPVIDGIDVVLQELESKLSELDAEIRQRIRLVAHKKQREDMLLETFHEFRKFINPAISIARYPLDELKASAANGGENASARFQTIPADTSVFLALSEIRRIGYELTTLLLSMEAQQQLDELHLQALKARGLVFDMADQREHLNPAMAKLHDEFSAQFGTYVSGEQSLPELRRRELETLAASDTLLEQCRVLDNELHALVRLLLVHARTAIDSATREAETTQHTMVWLLIGVAGFSLLFSILLGWIYVGRRIIFPIASLAQVAREIEAGNMDQRAMENGEDELGDLTRAFNSMMDNRRRIERELEHHRQHLQDLVAQRTGELEEATHRAEAANRAKSIFLANMSHELRTPLNAVLGFAQLLQRDPQCTSRQRQNLVTINRAGEHLLAMINDVLDLSKIEAGKAELNLDTFDLTLLFNDLAEMFRLRAQSKEMDFYLELDTMLVSYVEADQGKLRQVLINLLGNALKFTEHGSITLRARCIAGPEIDNRIALPATDDTGKILHVEVEDTGAGIAAEELGKIFDPFAQASASTYIETKGTGLGLAISRSFIELMGGAIEARSTEGKGTCFRFEIPLQAGMKAEEEAETHAEVVGLEAGQEIWRILVVDDNDDNRTLLTGLLEPLGFALREACNGAEAVELFQTWSPHFIWLDMRMPVMDGYQAARRIRALSGAVQIVAVTATALHEQEADILAAGCDDIVRKPFTAADIFTMLEKRLGVRYRYAQAAEETPSPALTLHVEDLARLPQDLLQPLLSAVLELDQKKLDAAVEQIRLAEPAIADAIQALAKKYAHEQLMELCEQALEKPGGEDA